MLETLIFMAALVGLVWFWADSMRTREVALRHCARACQDANVQFLDQTVAQASLGLGRDARGRLVLRRRYGFEFSTNGTDRHRGVAAMTGRIVEFVRLEHPGGPFIMTGGTVHAIN
ncbi:MAG: hypothetical protein NFCOHLIN_01714 [Gammaproteobacteria bacterium]|nr:hypothetical protein [Gammaproteobacteria bacterium]